MNDVCSVVFSGAGLKTEPYERTCRYHRKPGQEFNAADLIPDKCCPHLYAAVYPFALAVLYGGDTGQKIVKSCPAAENNVSVEIIKEPLYPAVIGFFKRTAVRILQMLKIPAEFPERNVFLKVVHVEGSCPLGIQKGEKFSFNLFNKKELCPASFYNLYPALLGFATGQREVRKNISPVHCPDPYGICYSTSGPGIKCEDFFRINLRVSGCSGDCSGQYAEGREIKVHEELPGGMCPLAFYSVYPYFITLSLGGSFEWVRKGEFVRVQCPKHNGVIMEAEYKRAGKDKDSSVEVRIHKVLEVCPKGHSKGDKFMLNLNSEVSGICSGLFAGMIPFKYDMRQGKKYACRGPVPGGHYRAVEVEL